MRNFVFLGAGAILLGSLAVTATATEFTAADQQRAEQIFNENCASCHGHDLGGYLAPPLNKDRLQGRSLTSLRSMIMAGVFDTLMPPFYGRLSDEEIRLVANRILTTPKLDPSWTLEDIRQSLKIHVADESTLPDKPTYAIDHMDDLLGVAARGRYGRGEGSKAVFINSASNTKVGEIPTKTAAHIIEFNPVNPRWAYVKTDTAEIYKVDLYSMKVVREIKTGLNGPALGVSRDGRYLMAGSFVPHNAVLLDANTLEPLKYFKLEGVDPDGKFVTSDSGMITGTPYADVFAIALENAGQVWVVDLTKPDFPVTPITDVGRHLHDAFLSHGGRKLMVASYDDSIVAAVDLAEKKIIQKLPAGCVPHVGGGSVVQVNGRTLGFGTNFGDCQKEVVSVWDLDRMEVVKQVPVLGGTESPAAHYNAPYVAVDIISKDRRARTIQLIDKNTLEVAKTLDVGGHAYFPEYNASGNRLYVSAGYNGDEVVAFDSKTLERVASFPMESPAGIFSRARAKFMTRGLAPAATQVNAGELR
jgi:mono/diheme cytochrome c family protein/DNA-binding beta-propeller fold protein YncE